MTKSWLQWGRTATDDPLMARFGTYLMIAGAVSGLLSFFDYEFSLLMWIDSWGNGVAWLIRGGLILIGMGLVSSEMKAQQPAQVQQHQDQMQQQGPVS